MVFLDTSAKNLVHADEVKDLEALKNLTIPVENHLVLSISEKQEQLDRSIRQFSPIGISSLIFSKIDQCLTFGEIFNLSHRWGLL